jgi:hypothetical protein
MVKLILVSIVIMTFVVPMRAARASSPVRGLRRAATQMALFIVLYVFAILVVLPRLA